MIKTDNPLKALKQLSQDRDLHVKIAFKITDDETLSEDLVQEMYIKIYERISDPKKAKLEYIDTGYVRMTLRNLFYKKKRKKEIILFTDDLIEPEDHDTLDLDKRILMDTLLMEIPYLHREVLLRLNETTFRKLSKETNVPVSRLQRYKKEGMKALTRVAQERGLIKEPQTI